MASSSTSSPTNSIGDEAFRCGICLDLIYKPVVLACGHISCFWCVHKAMHGLRASYCAICRQQYYHFPSICQLLHLLLLKMEPLAYDTRDKEILEEEKNRGYFSPQFVERLFPENLHAADRDINKFPETELHQGVCKQVSIADVLCAGCKELLFRPAVLNCGHVYCESCMSAQVNGPPLKCQVCHCIHPGNFPKVCLELDHFLEEQFPKEYSARRENAHNRTSRCEHGDSSFSTLESQEQKTRLSLRAKDESLCFQEDLSNTHVGVGCDLCGMYPIIGKRYRCKDCKERVGFDVCEACYHTSSKLPGRFNQQHTSDHRLELDNSRLLSKIFMRGDWQPESSFQSEEGEEEEDISEAVNENEA